MTQSAVVTKILSNTKAEVVVSRLTACGGNCGACDSCICQSEMKIIADNLISARPGQKVTIESSTAKVYKAVFLVYVMPLVLFLIGYTVSSILNLAEGLCIVISFFMLTLGGLLVVKINNRIKPENRITYKIKNIIYS